MTKGSQGPFGVSGGKMNIIRTQYTFSLSSFDIYLAGCKGPHCVGCHNPTSWSFISGEPYTPEMFYNWKFKIDDFDSIISKIFILGGEPLDQTTSELLDFLEDINKLQKSIWLFTKYDFKEVPKEILSLCDYVKCGRYIESQKTNNNIQCGVTLASSNQMIYQKTMMPRGITWIKHSMIP